MFCVSKLILLNLFTPISSGFRIKFLTIGAYLHLDGFLFELPGEEFGRNVHKFSDVLRHISDHDSIKILLAFAV